MALRIFAEKRNPWFSNLIGSAAFVIGAEAGNAINVAVQLRGPGFNDIGQRGKVSAYLASDVNGDVPLTAQKMPSGGFAIGTDGTILPGSILRDALIAKGTLAIDVVPEKFKTTTTALFRVGGYPYSKAAAAAIVFSAAHVVTASKFGVILVQVTAAGVVSTKVPVSPQAYNSAALAYAALPAPDAGNVALGYIAIAAKGVTWTANTDDMTNGSDLTTATFNDAPENGQYTPFFDLISEADGDIDITFSETRVNTFYLVIIAPSGKLSVSDPIAFV